MVDSKYRSMVMKQYEDTKNMTISLSWIYVKIHAETHIIWIEIACSLSLIKRRIFLISQPNTMVRVPLYYQLTCQRTQPICTWRITPYTFWMHFILRLWFIYLEIYRSYLHYIAEYTFSGPKNMVALSLAFNVIHSFKKGLVPYLKKLCVLHLSSVQLTSLDPHPVPRFRWPGIRRTTYCGELKIILSPPCLNSPIEISEIKLTIVGALSFSGQNNLEQFDLSQNKMSTIHNVKYENLTNMWIIFKIEYFGIKR